jgi:hypothetical protein
MSSSVMVARTRIWRTIVAIMRGGNFCGAAWQRPQFAWNLFSPSSLIASACALFCTTGVVALLLRGESTAVHSTDINAKEMLATMIFNLTIVLLALTEP